MCRLTSRTTYAIFLIYTRLSVTSDALFAQKNGNITLKTSITQGIQEVLWKFQGNKVADWDEFSGVNDYLQFKRRTSLVQETGDLTIFSLKSEDTGLYEGELIINGNIYTVKHDLRIIDPVSKSSISCKINDDGSATLLCQAEGSYLSYSWSSHGLNTGFNGQIGPNISRVESTNSNYSCVVKNPVSEMTERFKAADCFTSPEEKENKSGGTLVIVLVIILALLILLLGVAVFIYMKMRFSKGIEPPAHMQQGIDDGEENGQRERDNAPLPLPTKVVQVDEEAKMETNITSTPPKPKVPLLPRQNNGTELCTDMVGDIDGGETTAQTENTPLLKNPPLVPPKPVSAGISQNNAAISDQNGKEEGTEATNFASPPPQGNPSNRPTVAPKPQVPPFSSGSGPNEEEGIQVEGTHMTTPEKTAPAPPPKPSRLDSSQNADDNPAEDTDEA